MEGQKDQPRTAPRLSIYPTAGLEGKAIAKNSYSGETIAVFTSGGDAQGTDTYVLYDTVVMLLSQTLMSFE